MDPLTNYEIAKLRIAERHQQAARARMAVRGPSFAGSGPTSVRPLESLRRLVGRVTVANAGA